MHVHIYIHTPMIKYQKHPVTNKHRLRQQHKKQANRQVCVYTQVHKHTHRHARTRTQTNTHKRNTQAHQAQITRAQAHTHMQQVLAHTYEAYLRRYASSKRLRKCLHGRTSGLDADLGVSAFAERQPQAYMKHYIYRDTYTCI